MGSVVAVRHDPRPTYRKSHHPSVQRVLDAQDERAAIAASTRGSARHKRIVGRARIQGQTTHRSPKGVIVYMTPWDALITGVALIRASFAAFFRNGFLTAEFDLVDHEESR